MTRVFLLQSSPYSKVLIFSKAIANNLIVHFAIPTPSLFCFRQISPRMPPDPHFIPRSWRDAVLRPLLTLPISILLFPQPTYIHIIIRDAKIAHTLFDSNSLFSLSYQKLGDSYPLRICRDAPIFSGNNSRISFPYLSFKTTFF